MPSAEHLNLGELVEIAAAKPSAVLAELVERHRLMWRERGRPERGAFTFDGYIEHQKAPRRHKSDEDPLDRPRYTPDLKGYRRYLEDFHGQDLAPYIDAAARMPRHIEETRDRRAHTLVTGGSGSGKSELLKLLIHHYVRHPELGGVLVIDPHADLARQVARWREFKGKGAERLVYLDATEGMARGGWVPALNPLVRGTASQDELSGIAGQLANALAYFGGDGEGQTPQMQRLASFCLQVLLEIDGSTLLDLLRGLTVKARERGREKVDEPEFVKRGRAHPNEVVRDFFENDWDGESYRSTRDALKRRLSTHLRAPIFQRMMAAPQPLNLEALLNAGKVVVVNCAMEGGDALGRFLMAQVAAIGRRRIDNPRLEPHPIHVFVDEASELIAPPFISILEGCRKRNIWLTMAQQGAGEGGEREFINRVKRSTLLKLLGRSGTVGEIMRVVDVPRDSIPTLEQGDFIAVKTGHERSPMLLRTLRPSPLAGIGNAMSEAEFSAVRKLQARYYRQPATALPSPDSGLPAPADKRGRRGDAWAEG